MRFKLHNPIIAANSFIFAFTPTSTINSSPRIPKFFKLYNLPYNAGSEKVTAPPSIVLKTFVAWKLNTDASP